MKAPEVLLLGSAGRHAGKTGLACEVIRHHKEAHPLYAVKVTTIREETASCPRGGEGCGVCHAFDGRFSLEVVQDGLPRKDTTRLLHAGAARVFWLRVREEYLAEAVAEAVRMIPPGAPSVWESNAVRQVMDPGLFLILRDKANPGMKESCRRVLDLADQVIDFTGAAWSLAPERIRWNAGQWTVRQAATAIILAGGMSRRMGQDKCLLPVQGQPLIKHVVDQLAPWFEAILIGADDSAKLAFLNRPVIPDREPGQGPLMGLLSGLHASSTELNFVTACDIPCHEPHLLMRLLASAEGCDVVMPRSPAGDPEPLLAVYRRSLVPVIEQVLREGGRRFVDLFDKVRVKSVPMTDAAWYRNLNTQEDYQAWRKERGA